jgi:hypothetical protein
VRLILGGTVVRVRLDRKATAAACEGTANTSPAGQPFVWWQAISYQALPRAPLGVNLHPLSRDQPGRPS